MISQQQSHPTPAVPPPQTATLPSTDPSSSKRPDPFNHSTLRALPSLPHPDLLIDVTPAVALDLKRQLDHLGRLADRIGQSGLGERPPAPPSPTSLLPLPAVPTPPSRLTKVPASSSAQSLGARIKRRPKPSGRYSGETSGVNGGDVDDGHGGVGVDGDGPDQRQALHRVVERFNAVQEDEHAAQSSDMAATRSKSLRCALTVEVTGSEEVIHAFWSSFALARDDAHAHKKRKLEEPGLYARIRLAPVTGESHDQAQATLNGGIREIRLQRSPIRNTATSASPESSLAQHLTSQRLTLAEMLDRLPCLPNLLSSPCVLCTKYIRPPDGLPVQGIGFLPDIKAKRASRSVDAATKDGVDGAGNASGVKDEDPDSAEPDQSGSVEEKQEAVPTPIGRGLGSSETNGRWVNWHRSCDV